MQRGITGIYYERGTLVCYDHVTGDRWTHKPEYVAYTETFQRAAISCEPHHGLFRCVFKDYDHRDVFLRYNPNVVTYEADFSPIKRVMADTDYIVRPPRRGYYDIETDSRVSFANMMSTRVLCWCVMGSDGSSVTGMLTDDTDTAEKRLLNEYLEAMGSYDQAIAWNGQAFDEIVLEARLEYHQIMDSKWRRLHKLDQMLAFKRMNLQTAGSGDEKQSFAINAIGRALGVGEKNDFDAGHTYDCWMHDREKLRAYNVQDVDLQRLIEQKTSYLDQFDTLCSTCNVFPTTRSLQPVGLFDGYFARKENLAGRHLPTRIRREGDQFEGAYVMAPTSLGVLRDVHVADFTGMYPSVMMSWNMDPANKATADGPGVCTVPETGVRFHADKQAMIPEALKEFKKLRSVFKKKKAAAPAGSEEFKAADRQQNVYKVLMNSLYGVMGCPWFRYYDLDIAKSVTAACRWLIHQTADEARALGMDVVYADTDGLYIRGCSREEFTMFVAGCNEQLYPELLKVQGCQDNFVGLEYEKAFAKIVFPRGADGEPSAKRYAGLYSHYGGVAAAPDAIEIKGLEVKRGDTTKYARQMQMEAIKLVLSDDLSLETAVSFAERWMNFILTATHPVENIAISKSIKDLATYGKVKQAHVRVATAMAEAGEDITPGSRIRYVVKDARKSPQEVIPASEYDGTNVDRGYLWTKQVYPATMRLLASAVLGYNWLSLLKKSGKPPLRGQTSLWNT